MLMNLKEFIDAGNISSSAMAKKIGVHPVLISQWKNGIRPIPVKHCVEIENVTNKQITRQELRPNDFFEIWPDLLSDSVTSDNS